VTGPRPGGHDPATTFTVTTAVDEYLPEDADTVRAVVTVTAPALLARSRDRVEVVVVDNSVSMRFGGRLSAAKAAAGAAVEQIEDGVAFAVIAGHDDVRPVWPPRPDQLAEADPHQRAMALDALDDLTTEGGTIIGCWLEQAARLVRSTGDRRLAHVLLLSDGHNEHQAHGHLAAVVADCRGLLQCDCWGVGEDWDPPELRFVSDELGGHTEAAVDVDDPRGRDELVAGFRTRIRSSQARAAPDVALRVLTRDIADVVAFRQATPVLRDLGTRSVSLPDGEAGASYPLDSWAPAEARSYFVGLRIRRDRLGAVGDRLRVASVALVLADGTTAARASLTAEWCDDPRRLTGEVDEVQRHLSFAELAEDTDAGTRALHDGDRVAAEAHLARAWRTARRLGAADHEQRLARLVRVDDATGVVELLDATSGDVIRAQTYATSTAPYPSVAGAGGGPHDRRDDTAQLEYIDLSDVPDDHGTPP
jgi:hypothetical protein